MLHATVQNFHSYHEIETGLLSDQLYIQNVV